MIRYIRISFTVIFLIFTVNFTHAEENTSFWEKILTLDGLEQYHGTVGEVFQDSFIAQADFFVVSPWETPCGNLYFDLWWSLSPEGGISSDFGDEVDYTIGCSRPYSSLGGATLDLSVSFFDLYELGDYGNGSYPVGDIVRLQTVISDDFYIKSDRHSLDWYIKYEYSFTDKTYQTSGGILHIGLNHKSLFSILGVQLTSVSKIEIFHDSGVYNFESGLLGFYEGGLEWGLGKWNLRLPHIRASVPINVSDRKTLITWGARVTRLL